MTVAELIDRIIAAYPGATPEAMKAFKSAFYARLRHREGDHLEAAMDATLAAFKPTTRQPFPIPADVEQHLPPSIHASAGIGAPLDLKGHAERKAWLMREWWQDQGMRIQEACGSTIAAACEHEATKVAHLRAWSKEPAPIELTAAEIGTCEERVVSSERMLAHGVRSLHREDPTVWQQQMDSCRTMVRAGRSPSAEAKAREGDPVVMTSRQMARRLGELAAASRTGKPRPPVPHQPVDPDREEPIAEAAMF